MLQFDVGIGMLRLLLLSLNLSKLEMRKHYLQKSLAYKLHLFV
jgi:hypothetical protein